MSDLSDLIGDLRASALQIPHRAGDVMHAAVLSIEQAQAPGGAGEAQSTFTGDGSALISGAAANVVDLADQLSDGLGDLAVSLLKGRR